MIYQGPKAIKVACHPGKVSGRIQRGFGELLIDGDDRLFDFRRVLGGEMHLGNWAKPAATLERAVVIAVPRHES